MTAMRPAPADLAEIAATETVKQMMVRYRASKSTIYFWMQSQGIVREKRPGGLQRKPLPADFRQHYRKTLYVLREMYGVGDGILTRWRRELGGVDKAPPPEDFADRWRTSSIDQLRTHYQRGWITIARWCTELGLARQAPVRKPRNAKSAPVAVRPRAKPVAFLRSAPEPVRLRSSRPNSYQTAPRDCFIRDMSDAGQAADYLRRFGPVVRCDERGRYDESGKCWRRNTTVLTAAEIIERAELNGWRSDDWAKVA